MESDILFASVVKGFDYTFASEVIVNVLDVRGRMGKPTVFISDRSIYELTSFEKKNPKLLRLLEARKDADPMRYPFKVEYLEV